MNIPFSVHHQNIQLATPIRIRHAICRTSEIISPLQYYSQKGESIHVFEFSSHKTIGKLFVHLDPNGILLAQVFIGDEPNQGTVSYQTVTQLGLQHLVQMDSDFAECLLEMHLIASQTPLQVSNQSELEQLSEQTKQAPIIIGGCGRSGTTLLLSILGAHPDILSFPEELYAFYPKPFRLSKLLSAIHQYGEGRSWQRWCEKTPKNVRVFGDIQQVFDGRIKTIHVVRDGRDVVTSHHPNDLNRYYVAPERWIADVSCGLNFGGHSLLVRYEDLVKEPKFEITKICEYIEEEFDPQMLAHDRFSTVQKNKAWDGNRVAPLNTESIGHWQNLENTGRVEEFMNFPGAAELMQQLHYA